VRFLLATDGSRGASVAEDFLLALPLGCDDEVTIVTTPTVSEREAYALLTRVHWRFAARHIPVTTALRNGAPAEAAEALALERAADVVVVGSRGLGQWSGTLLGSVSRAVARSAPVSVLVVRARRDAPRSILLALDGSEDARAALRVIETMPLPASASVELMRLDEAGHERLCDLAVERARSILGPRLANVSAAGWDHAGESVLRHGIATSADLIVLGARRQTIGTGLMRTSIADHVLSHAHCAVLVAKPPLTTRRVEVSAFVPAMRPA
jgi:nucleotide-binding universal stress UspA family protein